MLFCVGPVMSKLLRDKRESVFANSLEQLASLKLNLKLCTLGDVAGNIPVAVQCFTLSWVQGQCD
jgi:hypothetical protein